MAKGKRIGLEMAETLNITPQSARPQADTNHPITEEEFEVLSLRIENKLSREQQQAVSVCGK